MSFMNENANLSLKNREEICLLAHSFRERFDIIAINGLNTLMSILTLLFLYLLCNCKEILRIWALIGKDLKVSFCCEKFVSFIL
jgi:hypothetical protein